MHAKAVFKGTVVVVLLIAGLYGLATVSILRYGSQQKYLLATLECEARRLVAYETVLAKAEWDDRSKVAKLHELNSISIAELRAIMERDFERLRTPLPPIWYKLQVRETWKRLGSP